MKRMLEAQNKYNRKKTCFLDQGVSVSRMGRTKVEYSLFRLFLKQRPRILFHLTLVNAIHRKAITVSRRFIWILSILVSVPKENIDDCYDEGML